MINWYLTSERREETLEGLWLPFIVGAWALLLICINICVGRLRLIIPVSTDVRVICWLNLNIVIYYIARLYFLINTILRYVTYFVFYFDSYCVTKFYTFVTLLWLVWHVTQPVTVFKSSWTGRLYSKRHKQLFLMTKGWHCNESG